MRPCLVPQSFDAEVLGRPYFRVLRLDPEALGRELAALPCPCMADAKIPAEDVDGAKTLQQLGFFKVCVLFHLARNLTETHRSTTEDATPSGSMQPDAPCLDALTANFRYNRMNLDPFVPPDLAFAHQRRWLANTFASSEVLKFTGPRAVVSFRRDDHLARIDLVSVVGHRRGLGTRLFAELFAWCAREGLSRVEVTTEAENLPAWRFYMKNGFEPVGASCVFHLHRGDWP
ncbi:hypothetical protein JCM15519_37900 [Fundidesulfovibrio butyratiphilus]